MKTTTIHIRLQAEKVETDPNRSVNYILEDENNAPLLHDFTMEELESLDDERLESIMMAFDCIRELFEKAVENRNEKNLGKPLSRYDIAKGKTGESNGATGKKLFRAKPNLVTGKVFGP
jgi:hypothetical protein